MLQKDKVKNIQIKDVLLGDISIDPDMLNIIDDPHFQRLRYIKQNGLSYLVYPGANSTRFEHSLGVMEIARQIAINNDIENYSEIAVAGLLHDIGHSPFSHSSESIVKKYLKKDHEQIGLDIISNTSIKDKIRASTLSYSKIISYLKGEKEGKIITGALGADRIDYLMRDSYFMGTAYGMLDYPALKSNIIIKNSEPVLLKKGINMGEHFLLARYYMNSVIYHQHTVVIIEGMYERALEEAIESNEFDINELIYLNDYELLARLKLIKSAKGLVERLINRNLFKLVYYDTINKKTNVDKIKKLIEDNNFNRDEYIIKLLEIKNMDDINISDSNYNIIGTLSKLSPIIRALNIQLKENKTLVIACDKSKINNLDVIINEMSIK
ncbi:MAG: HD domain-containing protein [Candidatus Micrarchaeia archaeon]